MDSFLKLNETKSGVLAKARSEFEAYRKLASGTKFSFLSETRDQIGKLMRDIERKRQTQTLTPSEAEQQKGIDQLLSDVEANNRTLPDPARTPNVYNLEKKKIVSEEEYKKPLIIPEVSSQEADSIIANLNQQFEEKVLANLKKQNSGESAERGEAEAALPEPGGEQAESQPEENKGEVEQGRSLSDFLSAVRGVQPDQAFSDPDSSKHLGMMKP